MANKNLEKLKDPFPAEEIEWRAGSTNPEKTRALALAYLTSRAVMNRLDDVLGPENWRDEYQPAPAGGVMCGISIQFENEWVTKWDVGENTDFEAIKGGFSDAFKRAAVKWGIGRYLYSLDAVWCECEQRGKSVILKGTPKLPTWALPTAAAPAPKQPAPAAAKALAAQPAPAAAPVKTIESEWPWAGPVGLDMARTVLNAKGVRYIDIDAATLGHMLRELNRALTDNHLTPEKRAELELKRDTAVMTIDLHKQIAAGVPISPTGQPA